MTDLDSEFDAPAEPKPVTRPVRAASDRSPPHSAEAEEHVIACCLLDDGATLSRALENGLTPTSFYAPQNRLLFEVCCSLKTPTLETLVEELRTRRQLEAVGGMPYLMQVTSRVPTTAYAGYFIEKVREKHILREVIREATGAVERAYGFTGGLEEYLAEVKTRLDWAAGRATTKKRDRHPTRVRHATPPPEPQTRLFLAGKPIATPGNLVTIISRAKTGKTATLGAATAAIIAAHYDRTDLDTFKFTAPHTKQAVVLIDTEQSPYDAWTCHDRTIKRAGSPPDPDWLYHYAMVGWGAADLRRELPLAIAEAGAAHGGVFSVILDGVADFVNSVNDEAECNEFITFLRALAVQYNTPIICVIHSNEAQKSGDDGRGHLGKQLTRKAESNLLLKKEGEVTTITSEKQRKAPITEADGVAFHWSEEHQRHVLCDNPAARASKAGRKPKHDAQEMLEALPAPDAPAKTINQIHRDVCELPCNIELRTFRDYMAKWVQTGEVERIQHDTLGWVFKRRY